MLVGIGSEQQFCAGEIVFVGIGSEQQFYAGEIVFAWVESKRLDVEILCLLGFYVSDDSCVKIPSDSKHGQSVIVDTSSRAAT